MFHAPNSKPHGGCSRRMLIRLALCVSLSLANLSIASTSTANDAAAIPSSPPHWIWAGPSRKMGQTSRLRKAITIGARPRRAELRGVADFCRMTVYLNAKVIADVESFSRPFRVNVTDALIAGKVNVLAVRCVSEGGPVAVCLRLDVTDEKGRVTSIVTDTSWLATLTAQPPAWHSPGFAASGWSKAISFGPVDEVAWGMSRRRERITTVDDYTQWTQALGGAKATDPATFRASPGFQIQLVRAAKKNEGSWVSMAIDGRGRVLIGREDRGVLRMTLPEKEKGNIHVETINDTLLIWSTILALA